MIKGIEGFYIVNQEDSELLTCYENFTQGCENWNMLIFSSAVTALQHFASNFGQKETKYMDFGDTRVFSHVCEEFKLIYLLRCKLKFKEKKAQTLLHQLREAFSENLKKYGLVPADIKSMKASFDNIVLDILKVSEQGIKQIL